MFSEVSLYTEFKTVGTALHNLASNSKETWRAIGGGREQHCIRFDRSNIEPQISDFESNIVTATPISRLPIRHVDVRILANFYYYYYYLNTTQW